MMAALFFIWLCDLLAIFCRQNTMKTLYLILVAFSLN